MTTEHPQVRIKYYGRTAEVDEGLPPLILAIWRWGFETWMLCRKAASGFVWLCFPNTWEASKFLNIIAVYAPDPDRLYQRMWGLDKENPNSWKYDTKPCDTALVQDLDEEADELHESHRRKPDFHFFLSIWFPPS